ncbi:MAG: bifunctional diaminohydroxyphosphoribosylaminopyrimidine deaminase/5-amino-6-(5-phosphoribosylamino)uracil reductase RibD [Muribaculaceae bacterium]
MDINVSYMRRALALARMGMGATSPNPMVGAVIVDDRSGLIIGEGWHRRCGCGHAEVNAVASVRDPQALSRSTMYVTLEPCSHYGKTPPCARLIINSGIPRVVVAAMDPFKEVAGRGIAMLRDAGIEVVTGVLADESRRLNARFMTAHERQRPFVTLKWAQSADGYIDHHRNNHAGPARFSTPLTSVLMHRLRSLHDAILVGSQTVLADNPRLDARLWPAALSLPRPVVLDARHRIDGSYNIMQRNPIIIDTKVTIAELLASLYRDHGITSLLVEGGACTLQQFIDAQLWDVARVETSPSALGPRGAIKAPSLSARAPYSVEVIDGNAISLYSNNPLVGNQ